MAINISVFCIWRDSEKHIYKTLKQLEDLESLKDFNFSFYFYENDSIDNTASILKKWVDLRNGAFLSETFNTKKFGSVVDVERMKLLCECRNKCKDLAGENLSDYSLILDSDIEFSKENFLLQINAFKNCENAVMITPNVRQNIPDYTFGLSSDSYYDVYSFRDRHGNVGVYFSDCPSYKKQDQFDWKIGKPIKCMSAFGGFAILKSDAFNKVKWSADANCDHVNMCFDLSAYGNIYCIPRSKVYVDVGIDKINVDSCLKIALQQKKIFEDIFS